MQILRAAQTRYSIEKGSLAVVPAIGPFVTVALNLVGPLPMTANGNKWILSLIDLFTQYPQGDYLP